MNNIQKLIDDIKAEKSKAEEKINKRFEIAEYDYFFYYGKDVAFDLLIRKLELLITEKSN